MDVNTEAKRIMAVSISKLYASRSQRGGMRLHRSLLLSMVMRSARDIYHAACLAREKEEQSLAISTATGAEPATTEVPMDTGDEPASPQTELASVTPAPPEPESAPEPVTQSAPAGAPKPGQTLGGDGKKKEEKRESKDKENRSPVSPDRHSRKRRGKAAAAPDFLPSKRARLEPGLERHRGGAAGGVVACCRPVDSLASLSLNRAIAAF